MLASLTTRPLAPYLNWPFSEYVFLFLIFALNVFLYVAEGINNISDIREASLAFTGLIQANTAILLFLATRNSIWQYVFGCTFERSIRLHAFTAVFVRSSLIRNSFLNEP